MRRWLQRWRWPASRRCCWPAARRRGGADGDLTDDWPTLRVPKPFTPATDTCLPRITAVVQASTYETVDCARNHLAETIHVGTFTGPDALDRARDRNRDRRRCAPLAPSATSGPGRCSAVTGTRPGSRCPRAAVRAPPGPAAPAGSAATSARPTASTTPARSNRTGSLRGALVGDTPAGAHGCFDPKLIGDNLNYMAAGALHRAAPRRVRRRLRGAAT